MLMQEDDGRERECMEMQMGMGLHERKMVTDMIHAFRMPSACSISALLNWTLE